MGKINVGRVLIGGLVAGVVLNLGEFVLNEVILGQAMKDEFSRLSLPQPDTTFIIRATGMTFLLGIAIVYLYAAIRPRFGAGMKAAACAGLIAWFFIYLYAGYIYSAMGVVSSKLFLMSLPWGVLEYVLGAIAGAWLYKEE